MAWTFEAGHRIRLDLAGSDWPNAWPPPGEAILTIDRALAELQLPVLEGPPAVDTSPRLPPPTGPQTDPTEQSDEGWARWRVEDDVLARERRAVAEYGGHDPGEEGRPATTQTYGGTVGVSTEDPGNAWCDGGGTFVMHYPEAECASTVRLRMRSDPDVYHLEIDLATTEDGRERRRRRWERIYPRDLQ